MRHRLNCKPPQYSYLILRKECCNECAGLEGLHQTRVMFSVYQCQLCFSYMLDAAVRQQSDSIQTDNLECIYITWLSQPNCKMLTESIAGNAQTCDYLIQYFMTEDSTQCDICTLKLKFSILMSAHRHEFARFKSCIILQPLHALHLL